MIIKWVCYFCFIFIFILFQVFGSGSDQSKVKGIYMFGSVGESSDHVTQYL